MAYIRSPVYMIGTMQGIRVYDQKNESMNFTDQEVLILSLSYLEKDHPELLSRKGKREIKRIRKELHEIRKEELKQRRQNV